MSQRVTSGVEPQRGFQIGKTDEQGARPYRENGAFVLLVLWLGR